MPKKNAIMVGSPSIDVVVVLRYAIISDAATPRKIDNRTKVPPKDIFNRVCISNFTLLMAALNTEFIPSIQRIFLLTNKEGTVDQGVIRSRSLGRRVASRTFSIPNNCIVSRSTPRPNPPCGGAPYLNGSR